MNFTQNIQARSVQAIQTALERDNFMTAEDAKKFGIIDLL